MQSDGQKVTVRQIDDPEIVLNADDESILDAAHRGLSPLCLQRRRLCDLQMQSAAWQSGNQKPITVWNRINWPQVVLSCQALPLTSDVVVELDAKGIA